VITAVEYANTIRKSNSSRYDETTHIFTLFTNFYEKKTDIYEFFFTQTDVLPGSHWSVGDFLADP